MSFTDIKETSKYAFKTFVKRSIKNYAFSELKSRQIQKVKGYSIDYGEHLKVQDYLLPNNLLNLSEQKELFKIRTEMNKIPHNFTNRENTIYCRKGCMEIETNSHIYQCEKVNKSDEILINYTHIYNETLKQKVQVFRKIKNNLKYFEE